MEESIIRGSGILILDKIKDILDLVSHNLWSVTALRRRGILQYCSWYEPFKAHSYHLPWSTQSHFTNGIQSRCSAEYLSVGVSRSHASTETNRRKKVGTHTLSQWDSKKLSVEDPAVFWLWESPLQIVRLQVFLWMYSVIVQSQRHQQVCQNRRLIHRWLATDLGWLGTSTSSCACCRLSCRLKSWPLWRELDHPGWSLSTDQGPTAPDCWSTDDIHNTSLYLASELPIL